MLLQEVDYRERNLRFSEMSLFAKMLERLLMLVAATLPGDKKSLEALQSSVAADVTKMMGSYEAELYQDRYLPEYQAHARELSRREKAAEEAKRRRDQEALARVAALGEDS